MLCLWKVESCCALYCRSGLQAMERSQGWQVYPLKLIGLISRFVRLNAPANRRCLLEPNNSYLHDWPRVPGSIPRPNGI